MRRRAAFLLLSGLLFACDNGLQFNQVMGPGGPALQSSGTAENAGVVFGPFTFRRTTSAPFVETVTLGSPDFDYFEAPFVVHVVNGRPDGSGRASAATILIDGRQVLGPSAFNQRTGEVAREVTVGDGSTLEVRIASAPGAELAVWIEGRLPDGAAQVGPVGGGVTSADGEVQVTLPPGAVTERGILVVEPLDVEYPDGSTPRPAAGPYSIVFTGSLTGPASVRFQAPAGASVAEIWSVDGDGPAVFHPVSAAGSGWVETSTSTFSTWWLTADIGVAWNPMSQVMGALQPAPDHGVDLQAVGTSGDSAWDGWVEAANVGPFDGQLLTLNVGSSNDCAAVEGEASASRCEGLRGAGAEAVTTAWYGFGWYSTRAHFRPTDNTRYEFALVDDEMYPWLRHQGDGIRVVLDRLDGRWRVRGETFRFGQQTGVNESWLDDDMVDAAGWNTVSISRTPGDVWLILNDQVVYHGSSDCGTAGSEPCPLPQGELQVALRAWAPSQEADFGAAPAGSAVMAVHKVAVGLADACQADQVVVPSMCAATIRHGVNVVFANGHVQLLPREYEIAIDPLRGPTDQTVRIQKPVTIEGMGDGPGDVIVRDTGNVPCCYGVFEVGATATPMAAATIRNLTVEGSRISESYRGAVNVENVNFTDGSELFIHGTESRATVSSSVFSRSDLFVQADAEATVTGNMFLGSSDGNPGWCMYVSGATVDARGNHMEDCEIRVWDDAKESTFLFNDLQNPHVSVYGSATPLALCNWWGSEDGPTASMFYGTVDYVPYATTEQAYQTNGVCTGGVTPWATSLDFETLPSGAPLVDSTTVVDQYAARGVTFAAEPFQGECPDGSLVWKSFDTGEYDPPGAPSNHAVGNLCSMGRWSVHIADAPRVIQFDITIPGDFGLGLFANNARGEHTEARNLKLDYEIQYNEAGYPFRHLHYTLFDPHGIAEVGFHTTGDRVLFDNLRF